VTLHRATSAHGAVLAATHELCFPAGEGWSTEVFATQLNLPGVFGLIAPGQGLVLARVAADEAEILSLCVVPEVRRQGIARKLLLGAEHIAADWGAITLFLEVSDRNAAGLQLYQSSGFSQVGLRRRYYSDGSDGLILRKSI